MKFLINRHFLIFVAKFVIIFTVLYLGTYAVIGLAAPGSYYSSIIDNYFDYVSGIKNLLLYSTKFILSLFDIQTSIEPNYLIRFVGGRGVYIARDCVGFGVYSFWIAYVTASDVPWKKMTLWSITGVLTLFLINATRITLFLTAINKGWPMPLGIDHHTWFTIVAYLFIFGMIFLFNRQQGEIKNA